MRSPDGTSARVPRRSTLTLKRLQRGRRRSSDTYASAGAALSDNAVIILVEFHEERQEPEGPKRDRFWNVVAYARDDGEKMWEIDLPSVPLHDGLAIAATSRRGRGPEGRVCPLHLCRRGIRDDQAVTVTLCCLTLAPSALADEGTWAFPVRWGWRGTKRLLDLR